MAERERTPDDEARLLQIGEVAERLGLSLRTIRHYEEVGVVVPSGRSSGGYRQYTEADVDRLRKVMGMKPMGFSLEEIRAVLAVLDALDADPTDAEAGQLLRTYAALAGERRDNYRRKLALASDFTAMIEARAEAINPAP